MKEKQLKLIAMGIVLKVSKNDEKKSFNEIQNK